MNADASTDVRSADTYDWLRGDGPDVETWQAEQVARAVHALRSAPHYEAIHDRLDAWYAQPGLKPPSHAGPWWFELATPDDRDRVCLCVATELTLPGDRRILVDPAEHGTAGRIDWFVPSRDGARVAVGISSRGDEQSVLHVVETATGAVLPDRLPHTSWGTVVWDPDGAGFHYTAGRTSDHEQFEKLLWHHRLGAPTPTEPDPQRFSDDMIAIAGSGTAGLMTVTVSEIEPRVEWVKDLTTGAWTRFAPDNTVGLQGVFVDDDYVAVTTNGASRGRLTRIPLASSNDAATWRDHELPSTAVLQSVHRVGGHLVVSALEDACAALYVLPLHGGSWARVELPLRGSLSVGGSDDGTETVAVQVADFTQSPALYLLHPATGLLELVREPARRMEGVSVTRRAARSSDGVEVPYFVVRSEGADPDLPEPTVIYGYGGFNIPAVPGYRPEIPVLLEAGFTYVLANIRGGSEFGRDWWATACMDRRAVSYEDMAAVARDVQECGIAERGRVGVYGASNGGLMTAAMVVRNPELFGAAVSLVPVTDLIAFNEDPYFIHDIKAEFGDPSRADDRRWIATYSPYQNVPDAADFPATLLCSGRSDVRCPPWHSRVLAAKLQATNTGAAPILLRIWDDVGHLPSASRAGNVERTAEWVSFLCTHLSERLLMARGYLARASFAPELLPYAAQLALDAHRAGVAGAGQVHAEALDADLMRRENRQRYGTQVARAAGEPVVWRLDLDVTDDERLALGLPTLAELTEQLWGERRAVAAAVAELGLPADAHVRRVRREVDAQAIVARLGDDDRAAWLDGADLVFCWRGRGSEPSVLVGWVGQFLLEPVPDADRVWTVALRIRDADRAALSWYVLPGPDADLATAIADPRVFRGPAAPPPPTRGDRLRGRLRTVEFDSAALDSVRTVDVYLAPGCESGGPHPVVFAPDGWHRPDLVEPLVEAGHIRPVVLIAAASASVVDGRNDRAAEYLPGIDAVAFERHRRFFVEELGAWADGELGVSTDPRDRAVVGMSNGAAFAVEVASRHPDRFGTVLAFSLPPAYDPPQAPDPGLRHHLCAGTLDGPFHEATTRYAQLLERLGRDVAYREWVAGHDSVMWEAEFAAGLRSGFGPS